MNKTEARAYFLQKRKALSNPLERSQKVFERFLKTIQKENRSFSRVTLYRPTPQEVQTSFFLDYFLKKKNHVYFPKMLSREQMIWTRVSENTTWKKGSLQIEEPDQHFEEVSLEDLQKIDAVFLPGVAFGAQGERLGRGAGHYDRFLAQIPKALRIGLGFDVQWAPTLPQDPWDQPLDWVLTETHEYRGPRLLHSS